MGVDLLDLKFRIEREFEISFADEVIIRLGQEGNTVDPPEGAWTDIRVHDLVNAVELAIQEQQGSHGNDVFERVKKHIIECLFVEESEVNPEAWLVKDLGMS